MTDTRADRWTPHERHRTRIYIASRGKNIISHYKRCRHWNSTKHSLFPVGLTVHYWRSFYRARSRRWQLTITLRRLTLLFVCTNALGRGLRIADSDPHVRSDLKTETCGRGLTENSTFPHEGRGVARTAKIKKKEEVDSYSAILWASAMRSGVFTQVYLQIRTIPASTS